MELGEMKRNTSNWSNFACFYVARVWQRQLGFLVVYRTVTAIMCLMQLAGYCHAYSIFILPERFEECLSINTLMNVSNSES